MAGPVRRVESVVVKGATRRGRPTRTWDKHLGVDMTAIDIYELSVGT